jgi:hypothetical protein
MDLTQFDVFNGDADGLCALQQLRLAAPVDDAVLVTGVKRDIALLARVDAQPDDRVTVLDVSADVNHDALVALLARGARVEYFDHHYPGDLPVHRHLLAHIDTSPAVCTSLLVDRQLDGEHRAWAVVGAFGDNLPHEASAHARMLHLDDSDVAQLRELGEGLAYNAYGDHETDLIVHPAELFRMLRQYAEPLQFMAEAPVCRRIAEQKRADLGMAALVEPEIVTAGSAIYILPDEAWVRRVRGLFANELTNRYADLAHAVLSPHHDGGYTVSVRAPLARPSGADELCKKFASGGGRRAAAGINHLPEGDIPRFVSEMDRAYPG